MSTAIHTALNRETIVTLGSKLAPAAVVLARLRVLTQRTDTDLEEVVNLIRLDPALTFHVIRMSNSVLFGVRERNDSLEGAVGRVGFQNLYRLVGLSATQQVCQRDLSVYGLKASRIWENAVATAAAAEVLAVPAGIDPGLAYAGGLLRTLGRVIIDAAACEKVYPGEMEWPLVADWERVHFGTTAPEVTALLLSHWRFPTELVDAVRAHHDPFAEPASNVGACVLNLACGVAARFWVDLPGEAAYWHRSEAKLTLAGVTQAVLDESTEKAWAHYTALCTSAQ